jgi:hypothetical protein
VIEEFFVDDFSVFDCVEAGFVHGESFVGHGADLGGHVQCEADDEAVAVGPGAFYFATVDGVGFFEAGGFFADGVDAFLAGGRVGAGLGFDADDVGGVMGVDGVHELALFAEVHELFGYFHCVGHERLL